MFILDYLHKAVEVLPVLAKFAVCMMLIVIIPRLSRRVHLPEAVGLLLAGVLFGPHVLDIFPTQHPVLQFLAEVGMLLLMFFAGLEIDLSLFRQKIFRSLGFGVVTTTLPLLLGTLVTLWLGYDPLPAIVVGSLLSSHTMLGSTIVAKLGARSLEPMVVTTGATMVSDTLSLLVFAVCVPLYASGFSVSGIAIQVIEIVVFVPLVLLGLGRAGAHLLRRVENEEDTYFILMFGILAVTALLAEWINLPGIVGTFLAGLAVNAAVKDKPAKGKLEFMGNTLFIPIFFIVTGLLIDPFEILRSINEDFLLAAGIIGALIAGKWIAADSCGRAFGYTTAARRTIWSLTLPQVAATLAATLVALKTFNAAGQPLLDSRMLNAVLIMVLVTAILGPVLTQRYAPRMLEEANR
ncbi:cation:proton antiporter [Accumulibacter sp.]|uniref:cation:proton antiporter n=1 Tax=Accumulibacter sp. TaxID=2053492 RepID=UPI001A41F8DA|nr:cation:proton antiporter [Accumulibacter sp.]MBL8375798.1 cation:proton antiporter [Accumulibacter sp.]